ncbi:PAS domain S-box protein [Comamonas nitrativorans]|uniref:histidine kinase n=1 Tax=Comamonas nitrativorans TaxID=108437 RepID=A0ABV9GXG8_9BURK
MPTPPSHHHSDLAPTNPFSLEPPTRWWRSWWRSLSPTRQDRLAAIAPLVSVALFLVAIAASFWYLRTEEQEREQDALIRAVDYAQQRMRLRLLERQEQIMRLARDVATEQVGTAEFASRAETFITQYPELQAITWINAEGRVIISQAAPTVPPEQLHIAALPLPPGPTFDVFTAIRQQPHSVYLQPLARTGMPVPMLQLQVPITAGTRFLGTVLIEYSVDNLLRYATPTEVLSRYTVNMLDAQGQVLSNPVASHTQPRLSLPWLSFKPLKAYTIPIMPVGDSLSMSAQAYRTSPGLVGNGLFWLVGSLSVLTAWLLLGTWRHTGKRLRTQEALVAETNFRRAMENSILTGMRALDLHGRITYVNAAFCQMTGWDEAELVGQLPPYPYWPKEEQNSLMLKLKDELSGKTMPGGFQVRVQRKNGSCFDARLYVSPLIDAHGQHTGWMSSITDITEPNRIRAQLAASHERFTIVLESLDASVSVAPLGSAELLFANKLYRQWFGSQTGGHLQLLQQAGILKTSPQEDDNAISLRPKVRNKNAEVYWPELGKWLEVRSRYLTWVDGRLAQMVIATDITARHLAEEQAAQQAERAQTASRLITMGEMASSVAHELNQPLTAINNYCSGMLSRLDSGSLTESQMRFALEKTAHQAQRAGQVIQHIRSFVKRSKPNRAPAQVEDMVAEAMELANIELRRRNVRLSHHIAARLPPVLADAILIEQVLVNLMKNAAEAIDHGGRPEGQRSVELLVRPKTLEQRPGVEFAIQDTGPGLPPQVLERLFEAFFSTKSEGMGIGLNLCRSIVESHSGRLQAQNLYNGSEVTGCCFSFWIPLADPAALQEDKDTHPQQ